MPEGTTPNLGDQGNAAAGAAATGDGQQAPNNAPRTFTQEELDRIIAERLRRAVPADYEDLKQKAAQWDTVQEGQKTELQKAQEKAQRLEAARDEAVAKANGILRRASVLAEAATQNAVDPDMVAMLLVGNDAITVDKDGNVQGVKEAVKALLKEKPFLVKAGTGLPGKAGGEFGGSDPKTVAEKIADLDKKAADPKLTARERNELLSQKRNLQIEAMRARS